MKDRIKRIIESQHMTQQEFAENIKVAPATLSSIFTGRTAPSLKIVDAIKSRFPDISTDWLLFGRGAMTDYRNSEAGASFNSPTPPSTNYTPDFDTTPEASADISTNNTIDSNNGSYTTAETSNTETPETVLPETTSKTKGIKLVKNCDKHERHIVEIRIFYDDQTWETFVPKNM